jgi:hypothetical protein
MADDFGDRYEKLTTNPHLIAQCERLMPVLTLIKGTKDCPALGRVIGDVVMGIIALEKYPDINQTANVGGVIVVRGPYEGYSVQLWATDIYVMQMGFDEYARARDAKTARAAEGPRDDG